MKVCTCSLLFGILAYTHSFTSNTTKSNQKNVSLALETVLEFRNLDEEVDIKFLKNVRNIITKFKTVIDENSNHYTKINSNVRRDVKQRVETFWKQFKKKSPATDNIPNVKPYSKSRNNVNNSENIMNKVMKPEHVSRKDLMNIANKIANKKIEVIKRPENNKGRTKIKQSEYKKPEMKRDDEKNAKKRYKHTKKETVDEPLEKETKLSSQHTSPIIDQQRIKNEHQEQPNIDSLSGELFSSNEFYQEPQHNTTQYLAIIPEKISLKPSTNITQKPEKIEARNVTKRILKTKSFKIWIKESTRRLPKVVLDKLAIKPRGHESSYFYTNESLNKHSHKFMKKYDKEQQKWHGKIYELKYGKKDNKTHDIKRMTKHRSKNDTKYESRQKQKSKQVKKHKYDKTSEPNDRFILVHNRDFFRQNYVQTADSVFTKEADQNKEKIGPLSVELKQYKRWTTASQVLDVMPSKSGKTIKSPRATAAPRVIFNEIRRMRRTQQTSPPPTTNSSMRRLALAVPRAYSKRNKNTLSRTPKWHVNKSTEQPSSSDEGMTVEISKIKDNKKTHGQNAKRISPKLEKEPYVTETKSLERELNEVKSRIDVNTDVEAARKVTHSFGANNDVIKRKQTETRFKSDVNHFHNDFKFRQDNLKMTETADNKTKHIIENKYVKDEDSTINRIEDDIQKGNKSETVFKSDLHMMLNDLKDRTANTKEAGKPNNKTDVKDKDLKDKVEIVEFDSEIENVTKQKEIIKNDNKSEISLTNIDDVISKAKNKGGTVLINDHDGDNTSKETGIQNRKIASLSAAKATKSIIKTTTTVQPNVAVTTPTTLRLSTITIASTVAIFNATVHKSKKRILNNTSHIADVSKTTLNVTKVVKSELIYNDFKETSDKTNKAGKSDNKTDVKDKDFKNKEEIVEDNKEIGNVTKQKEIIKKENEPEISLTNIGDVSPKAKDKRIKVLINDHDGDDASKETGTQNRKVAFLSTAKATKSITKTTTTVQPTVAVTTPTTLRLSTISIPVSTFNATVEAEFNATVHKSKNRMLNNTSHVADVNKTTLNVTKILTSESINTNITNLQRNVSPTKPTSYYQEKI